MSDNLHKIKVISDHLAAAGRSISEEELMLYILGSLSPEYDALVTSITTRADPIDLDDLHGHLLSHELRLERAQIQNPDMSSTSANISHHGNHSRGRDPFS